MSCEHVDTAMDTDLYSVSSLVSSDEKSVSFSPSRPYHHHHNQQHQQQLQPCVQSSSSFQHYYRDYSSPQLTTVTGNSSDQLYNLETDTAHSSTVSPSEVGTGLDGRSRPDGSYQDPESSSISSPISSVSPPPIVITPTDDSAESPEKTVSRSDLTVRAEKESSKAKLIFSNAQLEKISRKATPVQFADPWPSRCHSVNQSNLISKTANQSQARRSNTLSSTSTAYHAHSLDGYGVSKARNTQSHIPTQSSHRTSDPHHPPLALRVVSTNYCTTMVPMGGSLDCSHPHYNTLNSSVSYCSEEHDFCSPLSSASLIDQSSSSVNDFCAFQPSKSALLPINTPLSSSLSTAITSATSPSVAPWLYDKISVDLASSLGKNNMSIVSNEKGEVGAFKLCAEIASILDHQLSTSQSFTPHDSAHLRDLLLSYNFNCLLRAHDVIIAELFDSQSNSSSPLGADSRGTAGAQMEGTTTASSSSPMPMTITLSKQHSAVMHHHSSHHVNNSTTPNGNCVETSLGVSPLSSPQLTSLHPHPEVTRVKQVNFHRNKGEPLGITLKILKTDQVVVSRVMIGGMIHRQKILNEGDEILEINGRSIRRHSEEELRELLNNISGDIVIKVTPKNNPSAGAIDNLSESFFVRAMFDYRPEEDTTSQAAAAFGLAFQARDILQILKHKTSEPDYSVSVQSSMHELHHRQNSGGTFGSAMGITENQRWWQARIVCRADDSLTSSVVDDFNFDLDINSRPTLHGAIGNGGGGGGGGGSAAAARKIGLVPSCLWRMEMIKNEKISGDKIRSSCGGFFTRKKKKINVIELNEDEIYERVVQLKEPLPRKSLLLVGAPGVGRRSIKNALIHVDHRFAYPKPHTSKPVDSEAVDEAGNSLYHHVPHHELVAAANRGEYLEVGKYNDAWFGTKFHTIDRIISSDLIPVLDIEPDSIKKLRNSKYMPYVVFVDAPRNFNSSNSSSPDDASIVQSFEQLLHVSMEIDRHYRALFDVTIENKSLDRTVELIRAAFDRVCTSANEWVPLNWVVTSENHHQYHTQTTSINTLPHHSTIS